MPAAITQQPGNELEGAKLSHALAPLWTQTSLLAHSHGLATRTGSSSERNSTVPTAVEGSMGVNCGQSDSLLAAPALP